MVNEIIDEWWLVKWLVVMIQWWEIIVEWRLMMVMGAHWLMVNHWTSITSFVWQLRFDKVSCHRRKHTCILFSKNMCVWVMNAGAVRRLSCFLAHNPNQPYTCGHLYVYPGPWIHERLGFAKAEWWSFAAQQPKGLVRSGWLGHGYVEQQAAGPWLWRGEVPGTEFIEFRCVVPLRMRVALSHHP